MIRLAGLKTVWAGVGLILIVNLAWLGSVAWDRRGEPRAEIVLTERELVLPLDRQEKSAALTLTLRLATETPDLLRRAAWTRRADLPQVELPWFDRAKLEELGFRIVVEPDAPDALHHYRDAGFLRAYVALEYDGDAWSRWLEERTGRVERLRDAVESGSASESDLTDGETALVFDRIARSRLFPIDVGLDAPKLEQRYRDRPGILVLPCLVGPALIKPDSGPPVIRGRVQEMPTRWIHVPRRLDGLLEPFEPTEKRSARQARERREAREGWPSPTAPRYRAVLAVGRSFASRLVQVETLEPARVED